MSGMSNIDAKQEERRKYVAAFNSTMVKIWTEQITRLGVMDTMNLLRSVAAIGMSADEKITSVTLRQQFALYGVFVDYGTGKEVPRGNPGDIGRAKVRQRRQWFSRKYYSSVMNLQEFFADSLGAQMARVVAAALDPKQFRRTLRY